jgi:cytochrome c556
MAIMSQAAEWHVFDTPEYREDSAEFRAKCRQLLKAADEQRTDAAALSYVQVTLSCVRCHQHMREKRVAASDANRRAAGIAAIDP